MKILYFASILIIWSSCSVDSAIEEITLDPLYSDIVKIYTVALCEGPNGRYITEVQSDMEGDCVFSQLYESDATPFVAKLTNDDQGYILDSTYNIIDTLALAAVVMIRSHEFHRMNIDPYSFFSGIKYSAKSHDKDALLLKYIGIDKMKNPIEIYFDKDQGTINQINMLNPVDTSETIQIINKSWTNSDYGKMVKDLEIIQAERDTFTFNFKKVALNE